MGNEFLRDQDLEDVSGGANGANFSLLAEEFAWKNKCSDCPYKEIYRPHTMCWEVYSQLLEKFISGGEIDLRCLRRG